MAQQASSLRRTLTCGASQVPFFGDQPFWGDCCHRSGVGPRPVPIGRLRARDLLQAFETFDAPEVRAAAAAMAERIGREQGAQAAVQHFHECDSMLHIANTLGPHALGQLHAWQDIKTLSMTKTTGTVSACQMTHLK